MALHASILWWSCSGCGFRWEVSGADSWFAHLPGMCYLIIDSMKRRFVSFTTLFLFSPAVFAACLETYQYSFDEHGNGSVRHYFTDPGSGSCTSIVSQLAYHVGTDPSGGITNRLVLVYSTGGFTDKGDVALLSTNSAGSNVVYHMLRFYGANQVIFYAADNSGSMADVGIPSSGSQLQLSDHMGGSTGYHPASGQPGYSFAPYDVQYTFLTERASPAFILSTNRLSIAKDESGGIFVSWSTNASNFVLYGSANLFGAPNWTPVTNTPVVADGQNTVLFPAPLSGNRFFRLLQQ